jgi:hypothetical protein
MKKIQLVPVWLQKMVFAQHNCARRRGWQIALCARREECNKYDLTGAQCFWLAHNNDWFRWFAISSPPTDPYLLPQFQFYWGVCKNVTKLGCEKYFRWVTYWAQLEMLLKGEISHSNRIWRVHHKAAFLIPTWRARFCIRAQAHLHKARSAKGEKHWQQCLPLQVIS